MDSDYFKEEPWSFGSLNTIRDHKKDLTSTNINNILAKNDIYTRFKRYRKPNRYSPIFVYKRRELFQADVVFFNDPDMVKANDGYRYLFTCIDCFSKMAWIYPLKRNTCDSVMNCFKDILSICGEKPERLNSDRGSELICKKFRDYLKEQKIHHYLSYSVRKCPIIERFNLTIQNLLYKIMTYNRSLKWCIFIDQAMKIYLNRKHSTIRMSPLEAEKKSNSVKVRANLLTFFHKRGHKKRKPKFALKDTVRIWQKKTAFQRGYDENYSMEHFTIIKIKKNLPVPRYILQDSKGEKIIGSFFEQELVRYNPSDKFDIQIIDERKRGRKKEFLVHYIGFPKSMDEWTTENNLVNL